MNADLLVPLITSLAWLVVAASALVSFRLGLSQIVKMALVWIVIFLGLYLVVEWLMVARSSASSLM